MKSRRPVNSTVMPLLVDNIEVFVKRLAPFLFSFLLVALPTNYANSHDRINDNKENLIKCSIAIAEVSFSKQQPARVQITIENISGQEIRFWAEYKFELKTIGSIPRQLERVGDSYYSRSGIATKNGQLVLVPKDLNKMIRVNRTTSRFVNEEVRLTKGERRQISVDITDLLWADGMSSYWPSERFADLIPKGKYRLWFELDGNTVHGVSNSVDVEIK